MVVVVAALVLDLVVVALSEAAARLRVHGHALRADLNTEKRQTGRKRRGSGGGGREEEYEMDPHRSW